MIRFGNTIQYHLNMQSTSYFLTGRASSRRNTKTNLQKIGQHLGEGILILKIANMLKRLWWLSRRRLKRQGTIKKRKRNSILSKKCMSLMKGGVSLKCSKIYSSHRIKYPCSLILSINWSNCAKHFIKRSIDCLKLWFNLWMPSTTKDLGPSGWRRNTSTLQVIKYFLIWISCE